MLSDNLNHIWQRIEKACLRAGRESSQVKLVAVSKGQSVESMRQLAQAGQLIFGESYLQEASQKIEQMADLTNINWHFIGHLQSNKAAKAAGLFATVHSVHNQELANRLNLRATALNKSIDVLIQADLANEAGKHGCQVSALAPLAEYIAGLSSLRLKGLMTLPPITHTPENARPYFARLRELAHNLQANLPAGSMRELSMGMSDDFEIAVEEGATLLRVGTILFGPRRLA